MFLRVFIASIFLLNIAFAFNGIEKIVVTEDRGGKHISVNGKVLPNNMLVLEENINLEMDRIKNGYYGPDFGEYNSFFTKFEFINGKNYKVETKYSKVVLYTRKSFGRIPSVEIEKKDSKYINNGNVTSKTREYEVRK